MLCREGCWPLGPWYLYAKSKGSDYRSTSAKRETEVDSIPEFSWHHWECYKAGFQIFDHSAS